MRYIHRGTIALTILFTLFVLIGSAHAGKKESTKNMVERVMRQKVESLKSNGSISVTAQKITDPLGSPFELYRVLYENNSKPMGSMTVSVLENDGKRFLFTGGAVWDLEQEVEMQYLWTALTEKSEIPYSDDHLIAGKAEGCNIPVAVFSDYLCYFCKRFMPEVKKMVADSDDMCLYLYDMPLTKLHKMAKYIAQMALAYQSLSGEIIPGSIYERSFEDKEDRINEYFEDLIAQKGISLKDFYKKVSSPEILAKIEKDIELSGGLDLTGTPSIFIDGHTVTAKTDQVNRIISYVRNMKKNPKNLASNK